jgi:hypothetical protein
MYGEIVNTFRAQKWPQLLRAAFAVQIRWRVRAALVAGDMGYAAQLVRFSLRAFGTPATAMVIGSRYGFGMREWRRA